MRPKALLAALLLPALLAAVLLAPSGAGASHAGKHHCKDVNFQPPRGANGHARHVVAHNMSCRKARRKILTWFKRGEFPQNQVGWFCQTMGNRMLCSAGNGRAPPFITFKVVGG
ncbi:MAG TPA: hypothetical protein VGE91_08930 [Solirubrobacterales bacterium]